MSYFWKKSKSSAANTPAPLLKADAIDNTAQYTSDPDSDSSYVMVGPDARKKKLPKRPSSIRSRAGSQSSIPELEYFEEEQMMAEPEAQAEAEGAKEDAVDDNDSSDGVSLHSNYSQPTMENQAITEQLETRLISLENENKELRSTIATHVSEQKAERNELTAHILGMRQSYQHEMSSVLDDIRTSTQRNEQQLQSVKDAIIPLQAQSSLAKGQLLEYKRLKASMESAGDTRHAQYTTMHNRIQRLETSLHNVTQELKEEASQQQATWQVDLEKHLATIHEKLVDSITRIRNDSVEEVSGLRKSFQQLENEITSLREKLAEVVAKLNEQPSSGGNPASTPYSGGPHYLPQPGSSKLAKPAPAELPAAAASQPQGRTRVPAQAPATQQGASRPANETQSAQDRHRKHVQQRVRVNGCSYCATSPTSGLSNYW